MPYTLEQIEYFHDNGMMPDWAYYQMNGKSAQANYREQHKKIMETIKERQADRRAIDQAVEQAVENAIEDLLKGFKP